MFSGFFRFFLTVALIGIMTAPSVFAQETAASPDIAGARPPERIVRPMRATSPMTLKAEGVNIRLWGIKPAQTAETPLELKALDLMDALIHEQQVNCKIVSGLMPDLVARCVTQSNQDLALELLRQGFVVVDRQQTYNSVFATAYEKEQEAARLKSKGIWRYVNETDEDSSSYVPRWLKPHMGWLLPLMLIAGPFGGLIIMSLVMYAGLNRIGARQQDEMEQSRRKEAGLQTRERQVLVSMLEGELVENKNKVEAFLTIYGDMLRSLKDPSESPKYQQVGDIIQKHPAFSRTVFESNVNKLSLLDIKVAGQISKLYSTFPKEQEYINLDPHVPLETAVKLVEKVLEEAKALLPVVDRVTLELQAAAQKQE